MLSNSRNSGLALLPVIRKELRSYFNSPIAYVVTVTFVLFCAIWVFYLQTFFAANTASLRSLFGIVPLTFIIIMPAITMRSWAEEKKLGTLEVLLTLPFRESTLVLGKFLAAAALLLIMIGLTLPMPLMLSRFGAFDWGEVAGQYIGVLLLGCAGISVGLFISSLATNQVSAFLLSLFVLLVFTLISQINTVFSLPILLARLFNYLALGAHFNNFQKGLIDTRDLLFYLLVSALFLYLNMKSLVFKKW